MNKELLEIDSGIAAEILSKKGSKIAEAVVDVAAELYKAQLPREMILVSVAAFLNLAAMRMIGATADSKEEWQRNLLAYASTVAEEVAIFSKSEKEYQNMIGWKTKASNQHSATDTKH